MSRLHTNGIPDNVAMPALPAKSASELRDLLTEMVVRDLLGPAGGPDEELDQREDRVTGRYLVGTLAPMATAVERGELDELAASDEDEAEAGASDSGVPAGGTFMPSSMGLSFVVVSESTRICIEAEWGKYERVESATQTKRDGSPVLVWHRIPARCAPQLLTLADGNFGPIIPLTEQSLVSLQGRVRRTAEGWIVTVFLVNMQEEPTKRRDEAWLFQPKLRVSDPDGHPVFCQRKHHNIDLSKLDPITREETETLEMLYRHHREFAVGHGVAVHATLSEPFADHATALETEFLPQFEVPQQTPRSAKDDPLLAGLTLDMKHLAEMSKAELLSNLRLIVAAYAAWVGNERVRQGDPTQELGPHQAAANRSVERAARALGRIRAGIDLIENNSVAEEAFRFANRAMWQQRLRSSFTRRVRKQEMKPEDGPATLDVEANRSWRLFQIVFMLLNLPGLTDLKHIDRSHGSDGVADLLWFATGGGKTEAYLGLTAYTLAMRRLQGEVAGRAGDHGVAVMMRYTMRLLTLQQFQRAAALLCACEVIRRENEAKWGTEPFRLGLWVGGKGTPNTLKQAAESLRRTQLGGRPTRSGTPHQITSCPWCGSEITANNLKVFEAPNDVGRCVTYCGDPLGHCEFSAARSPADKAAAGLPVMVVDEEIYRRPPSLLVATVDKFAQMPWRGETQMLFGRVNGHCSRHGFLSPEVDDTGRHPARAPLPAVTRQDHGWLRPPDLIIQDELHLISGPLGSMVGLYEAAVDELCSWEVDGRRVRPKVIASTATIRRAPDQVRKLFLRQLEVFPPQGMDIADSFFALQRPVTAETPGRRYLGICAFGRRYPFALIRTYVAYLAAAQKLYDTYDSLADPWMTLAGYFNSIRELAGTRRLVGDDIRSRLRDADQRGLAKRQIRFNAVEELTGRKSGTDIPAILDRSEVRFDKAREAERKVEIKTKGRSDIQLPYDVILATNMISVGVDIDRWGLMVVAGQPKNTSEYIQATSRIGRRADIGPGLVCTVYNWARPRDLSHFERFEHYHQTFYKHVEALSVTPFAPRALDRGLSGVLVALRRLWGDDLNANLKAGDLSDTDQIMPLIFDLLAERGEKATDNPQVAALIRQELNRRRDQWLSRVHKQTDHRLAYRPATGAVVPLLAEAGTQDWDLFTCLNSLRDVENTVNIILDSNPAGLRVDA